MSEEKWVYYLSIVALAETLIVQACLRVIYDLVGPEAFVFMGVVMGICVVSATTAYCSIGG